MHKFISLGFFLFLFKPLLSQLSKDSSFNLTVIIDRASVYDSLELGIIFPGFFKSGNIRSAVHEGEAVFNGTLSRSVLAFLYSAAGRTSEFLLEPGENTCLIEGSFVGAIPKISSANNQALARYIETAVNPIHNYYLNNLNKENTQIASKKDSLFQTLISCYNEAKLNATLFLWESYLLIGRYGYSKEIEFIVNDLPNTNKDSELINIVNSRLNATKAAYILTQLETISTHLTCESEQDSFAVKKRFILFKFWYSACGPCRVAFKDMANNPQISMSKNLEIIAVQVDDRKTYEEGTAWLKACGLNIRNYWDPNGAFVEKLSIMKFPTTFLVDTKEKIVLRDPTYSEIKKAL